jgi:hypothetical protein
LKTPNNKKSAVKALFLLPFVPAAQVALKPEVLHPPETKPSKVLHD